LTPVIPPPGTLAHSLCTHTHISLFFSHHHIFSHLSLPHFILSPSLSASLSSTLFTHWLFSLLLAHNSLPHVLSLAIYFTHTFVTFAVYPHILTCAYPSYHWLHYTAHTLPLPILSWFTHTATSLTYTPHTHTGHTHHHVFYTPYSFTHYSQARNTIPLPTATIPHLYTRYARRRTSAPTYYRCTYTRYLPHSHEHAARTTARNRARTSKHAQLYWVQLLDGRITTHVAVCAVAHARADACRLPLYPADGVQVVRCREGGCGLTCQPTFAATTCLRSPLRYLLRA